MAGPGGDDSYRVKFVKANMKLTFQVEMESEWTVADEGGLIVSPELTVCLAPYSPVSPESQTIHVLRPSTPGCHCNVADSAVIIMCRVLKQAMQDTVSTGCTGR